MMNGNTLSLSQVLIDLVGILTSPQLEERILAEAGVSLDRALFPLLVRIGVGGPTSVVDLAGASGRDHSTISRQVAKLESLGLIARKASEEDSARSEWQLQQPQDARWPRQSLARVIASSRTGRPVGARKIVES